VAKKEYLKRGALIPPAPRLNFLLGCSDGELSGFELARLAEVANLRTDLHVILDKLIDEMAQAALAGWFRQTDRQTLMGAIQSPEEHSAEILAWAKERIKNGQRGEEELAPRTSLAPGAAHLAAALRYQERNVAEGLCSVCPRPLARNSVKYCDVHLAKQRARYKPKGAKGALPGTREWLYEGVFESAHGKQPGTLAALARTHARQHQTTEKEKVLYSRVAERLEMTERHVRAVALGQRRSATVLAAITKETEQMATDALAALAEASEKRPKKRGREASSAFGVPVKTLIG